MKRMEKVHLEFVSVYNEALCAKFKSSNKPPDRISIYLNHFFIKSLFLLNKNPFLTCFNRKFTLFQ